MADKLYSDEYLTNDDYAKVGGMSDSELNLLEHEFLALIGFDLYISEERYKAYYQKLYDFGKSLNLIEEETPGKESRAICTDGYKTGTDIVEKVNTDMKAMEPQYKGKINC